MSKRVENSLFAVPSVLRFAKDLSSYAEAGKQLIESIKIAHSFRQTSRVSELASLLCSFPIKEYKLIGEYYLIWCACRNGEYQVECLERVIDQSDVVKARALMTRAAFEAYKGNRDSEAYFYIEALKAKPTMAERIALSRALTVVKAKEGFHRQSLRDIESLLPVLKYAEPMEYYDFLNSYAVELGEAGRLYEARNVCDIVLASPFAFAYHEWQETGEELRKASRSLVAVSQSVSNKAKLLQLPAVERSTSEEPAQAGRPAPVISLLEWKKKMPKGDQNSEIIPRDLDGLTDNDMKVKIFELACQEDISTERLRRILESVIEIVSETEQNNESF